MRQLNGWLKRENLKGFLVVLSEMIWYRFGNLDWCAFKAGLDPSADIDEWFTYRLVGRETIEISVSRLVEEGESGLRITFPDHIPCLREQIRVAWLIFNRFDVSPDADLAD